MDVPPELTDGQDDRKRVSLPRIDPMTKQARHTVRILYIGLMVFPRPCSKLLKDGPAPTNSTDPSGTQIRLPILTPNLVPNAHFAVPAPKPLGGRSCPDSGNEDVRLIFKTYRRTVENLTATEQRSSWAPWNNFSSSWNHYLGCGQQAGRVIEALQSLKKGSLKSEWTFEFEATPFYDFHVWGRATSKNPLDPDIEFDPWHDTIECQPHGNDPGSWPFKRRHY